MNPLDDGTQGDAPGVQAGAIVDSSNSDQRDVSGPRTQACSPGLLAALFKAGALPATRPPDPATIALVRIPVMVGQRWRSPSELELEQEDRAEAESERKARLAEADGGELRSALRQSYQKEDERQRRREAIFASGTARAMAAATAATEFRVVVYLDPAAVLDGRQRDRERIHCPACQADAGFDEESEPREPDHWRSIERVVPGGVSCAWERVEEPALVLSAREADLSADAIVGACLGGCASDSIGAAVSAAIAAHDRAEAAEHARYEDAEFAAEMDVCAKPTAPLEWLIPSLVPARASTLLVGESGDGKTWLMIHLAICIAMGVPFLGRPVKRGRVLLMLLESFEINEARIDCVAAGLGTTREATSGWLDVWRGGPFKSDDSIAMAGLGRRVRVRGYAAILIDNTTKLRTSRSQNAENDASVMSAVLESLAELAQAGIVNGDRVTETPPAVVTLHHAGRDGTSRGSSGIAQNVDYAIELRRKSQKDPESPITIGIGDGSRLACRDLPLTLRYRGIGPDPVVPELVTGEARATERASARPKHDRIVEILDAAGDAGLGANELAAAVGGSKRDVQRVRDELATEGAIELVDGLWRRA